MEFTQIYNVDNVPVRRLKVQQTLAVQRITDVGHALTIIREKIARQFAKTLTDKDEYMKMVSQHDIVTVTADVIVMTTDEFADVCRSKFQEGIRHANGFITMQPDFKE